MPLQYYMARYIPHCFITPHHALEKPNKALRFIVDMSKRYMPTSTPINKMTSTLKGSEMDYLCDDVFTILMKHVWDLWIVYPQEDLILDSNDDKPYFKQIKLHSGTIPIFYIVMADVLFLQSTLSFGTHHPQDSQEIPISA